MRSDLVFGAMANVSNRYLLSKLAAKAIRKFHRPNTRIPDTTNEVLARFSGTQPLGDETQGARPVALRIDRGRGASEKSQNRRKVKRAKRAEGERLAKTA